MNKQFSTVNVQYVLFSLSVHGVKIIWMYCRCHKPFTDPLSWPYTILKCPSKVLSPTVSFHMLFFIYYIVAKYAISHAVQVRWLKARVRLQKGWEQ